MTPGPSTEQLLVQVAVRALDEVLVTMVEEGPESEARLHAQKILELAFTQLWHRLPALDLGCMNDGLWWDEVLVLSAEDSRSALVSTLTTSGIESLGFLPGAEAEDLHRFSELLHQKAHDEDYAAKELGMLLFGADLPHLRYATAEADPVEEETPEGESSRTPVQRSGETQAAELRAAICAEVDASVPTEVLDSEAFDSTLYFLDRGEIAYLKAQVEKQYSANHTRSILDLLLDTLELQSDGSTRTEVIEAIRALLPYLLSTGRFDSLAYLGDQLRGILRQVELEAQHRDSLKAILQSVSRQGALTQIFLTLEQEGVDPSPEGLEALVSQVDQKGLETVLVWGGQLRRTVARDAVFGALETVFREQPYRLAQILASGQRAVVQEGLRMAGHLRLEALVEGVTATLNHEEASVRRQAVDVLGSIPGAASARGAAQMLRDPDPEVRMASYQVFLNRPYRGIARILRSVVESADLESRGLSERKLLFSAYGAAAGPENVPELVEALEGKRAFGQNLSSETRGCAALALARIGGPLAKVALSDARRSSDPLVRNAARIALQEDA